MINLEAIDRMVMRATQGLDNFAATFHTEDQAIDCRVMRDTLELPNEYSGVTVVESGAVVHYLAAGLPMVKLGDYFEFDGRQYVIENKVPTQDSNWRQVHCRVRSIDG